MSPGANIEKVGVLVSSSKMTVDVTEYADEGKAALPKARESVSVIIVSYWTGPLLVRSVFSALRQPEVAEVIVVNNGNWSGSMDRLTALAGDQADKLKIISGHGNVGYAGGCNIGARAATGKFLFILNPDAILPDNAVADMLSEAARLEGDWLLGGKLINPDGTEQAGARRSPLTPWTAFVEIAKLYKFAPHHPYFRRFNRHEEPCPGETTMIPVISGACMLMKRETFFTIDGMDEDYFLHVEDVDFVFGYVMPVVKFTTPQMSIFCISKAPVAPANCGWKRVRHKVWSNISGPISESLTLWRSSLW